MVKCECNQEMLEANSCTIKKIEINGKIYFRDITYYDFGERCHDCGIVNKKGNIHHPGCDIERCPRCGRQLIGCDCKLKGNNPNRNKSIITYCFIKMKRKFSTHQKSEIFGAQKNLGEIK